MGRRRGFTIVELLTAMLLLGTLSAMAVPRFSEFKKRSYVASMQSDLGNLRIAQEEHWAAHGAYATDTASMEFRITSNVLIQITSKDLLSGYTAVATHLNLPGRQCTTAMGGEAAPLEPGTTYCGPTTSGSSTIPSSP